jgi:hypothetical protein
MIFRLFCACTAFAMLSFAAAPPPQATGNAGTVEITVTDPSGAAVANAAVRVQNRVSRYDRTVATDQTGVARFLNVPPNQYHVDVTAPGLQPAAQDFAVRAAVPINLKITLAVATEITSVNVSDTVQTVESVPSAHTDLDRELFNKLPHSSTASGISDVITLAAPGVSADSNGFFHPLGDHAETGFSVDNQPITDQQSKQFTNQLPLNAFGSFEVTSGAPAAEFGDKASLTVNAITRSGLGQAKPFGSIVANYGSFGTVGENISLGFGGPRWGNFIVANSTRSGRYLDSPEFRPFHDIGNNQQFFDRIDYAPGAKDTTHLNLFFGRSWFQIPNTLDQKATGQDQRQLVDTINIAPGWVHLFSPSTALTFSPYYRQDTVHYYPSRDPFADQPATVSQSRQLRNVGVKMDLAYVKGIHNFKAGVQTFHYLLNETFTLGITDPAFNTGDAFQPGLAAFDLTRGGRSFFFRGHADIKESAFYVQDSITLGALTLQTGLRYDIYRGLSSAEGLQPRLGASYLYKPTATVFRASYSRFFETPYNENLVLSSSTGAGGLANNEFGSFGVKPLTPGRRNQYNAGIEQGIGKHIVVDADYFWKYTDNAFDFDTLFNSPIQIPIEWRKSKIDGFSARLNLAPIHGFSAFTVMGHTRARFFGPENGGIIFNSPIDTGVFRIDHDQEFEQTTHLRYQYKKDGPWLAFTWRYDSGMVAGRLPDQEAALGLTPNEQATIMLGCGNQIATPSSPIRSCAGQVSSPFIRIPPEGTFDSDSNPARIAPRNVFDLSVGADNLLHKKEGPRWTLQLSAFNLTNKIALYNFLSTFSGTHFVSPRSYRVELGYTF